MMFKEVKPKKLMCLTLCRCFKALPMSFIWCDSRDITKRECMGIEPTLYSPDNTVVSNLGVSESGSLEVLELWPHLSPSQIEAILRIVREGT